MKIVILVLVILEQICVLKLISLNSEWSAQEYAENRSQIQELQFEVKRLQR